MKTSKSIQKKGLVWIRRDLRLHDHAALSACLRENDITYVVFILDSFILDPISTKTLQDKRVHFIAESLLEMALTLQKQSAGLILLKGDPSKEIPKLSKELSVSTVYFNRDYEPYAIKRDATVTTSLKKLGTSVKTFKDHVIFEPSEILKHDNTPYKVFTPYSNAWLTRLDQEPAPNYTCQIQRLKNDIKSTYQSVETILDIAGFKPSPAYLRGGTSAGLQQLKAFQPLLDEYDKNRDFPELDATSHLSIYIRHGCVSIRDLLKLALSNSSRGARTWLKELIWREFYQMVLFHYPHSANRAFNPKYDSLVYPGSDEHFEKWKLGQTGFPLIDAAMRCFKETGWMHNRLRMVTASFLCKILLVDWRNGEAYFAENLLDFELASNNGGWQWASGTGCDAAPYFRIFNPYTQSKKFDEDGEFIKRYCPELKHLQSKQIHKPPATKKYPPPIVDYPTQREKALILYKSVG